MNAPRPFSTPVTVVRPALPPLKDFSKGLEEIWKRSWLTNNGPILQTFWRQLTQVCKTTNLSLLSNGTLALQLALQGLEVSGEAITTPYTFVATTHSLFWNKIRPVFVDIEPNYFSLDPEQVEAAITPWTSAIVAVHVYGYPCQLDALAGIARRHGLKLIYDAAHAFGVEINGVPIGKFGDASMFSFHATKVFHSIEGGMLTSQSPDLIHRVDYLKNFGFENETEVVMPGTNAKMSEFQALMGSLLLDDLGPMIEKRKAAAERYCTHLRDVAGLHLPPSPAKGVRYNFAYFPVQIDAATFGVSRDHLYGALRKFNVLTRRYFYPLIPDLICYRGVFPSSSLTVARKIADRILSLPIYSDIEPDVIDRICEMIVYIQSGACSRSTVAGVDLPISIPEHALISQQSK